MLISLFRGILAVALLHLFACGQNDNNNNRTPNMNPTQGYELSTLPNSGGIQNAVKRTADKQKILEEGHLINQKREGTWLTYFASNGMIETLNSYRGGQKNGVSLRFNEAGTIVEKATYLNDQLNGTRYTYNFGRAKEEATYINGKLNGIRKTYYDNGKVQEEGNFADGKRDGETKWYDEKGNLSIQYQYKNGEKMQ